MEESSSSSTVKLAGQTLQRQSSEDAVPMASSVIQVIAKPSASTQDSSDFQTQGLGDTASEVGKGQNSTFILSLLLTYLRSCTVFKLWLIIGQIFASESGVSHFIALAGRDPRQYRHK